MREFIAFVILINLCALWIAPQPYGEAIGVMHKDFLVGYERMFNTPKTRSKPCKEYAKKHDVE